MNRRTHPHDPHISNGMLARALIWITRKRIPIFRRLFTAYLNCDIGGPLPKSTFLPHPFGIVVSTSTIIGEDVVIGHQVTIGNRNGIMAAPTIFNRVYIGS
jgi:serine acetyltransferase